MSTDPNTLYEKLGYHFKKYSYLELALTHRSYAPKNNERLEFLGDSLLNFFVAEKLFRDFPTLNEGGLSRLRANLVNSQVLLELAQEFTLHNYLRLGMGELKSGGEQRQSILADVMEAVIGAIYLDGGLQSCQERVLSWLATRFIKVTAQGVKKDPKTQLQEYIQAKKLSLPQYNILTMSGKDHAQQFTVKCVIAGLPQSAIGEGTSRRRAEQSAAENLLNLLAQREK